MPLLPALLFVVTAQPRTLNVFAAASLKEAFTVIAKEFERANAGVRVRLQFAGSQQLASQIRLGAPADVFASAARQNLDQVRYDRSTLQVFARNRLAIVTTPGSTVTSLQTLDRGKRLVLADPKVPAGRYTADMLQSAAQQLGAAWLQCVSKNVVSRELDVRAVLAKVTLGEADAGIVYVSDAITAKGKVRSVLIPPKFAPTVSYPAAVVANSAQPSVARRFVAYLLTKPAQASLVRNGFLAAEAPKK
jgi:molybdate transport system substrate-binding protein